MQKKTLGDLTPQQELDRVIRVNHAGEYGAKMIYSGQLAVFKRCRDRETTGLIEHMKQQEEVHFDYFNQELINKKIRPTIMQPVWQCFGFGLGVATAFMGRKAAMACTVAVEEVIDEHYGQQVDNLKESELRDKIVQFRKEELEHRDIGLQNEAEDLVIYKPLTFVIKKASKLAIFISSRI